MNTPQPLVLVDASIYIFRAWHSMPDAWQDVDGESVNAVHGFLRFLLDVLQRERPRRIVVAFDEALECSYRNKLYPAYKANREPAPEALKRQFAKCRAVSEALGIACISHAELEADDLIGSLLWQERARGGSGLLISADKDLSQLLRGDDEQWDFARDLRWRADGVPQRYGVRATQIVDFLGLCGDAVDNIPGVPGIGAKTATALLAQFNDLDEVLVGIAEVATMKLRGAPRIARNLGTYGDQARLSKALATIVCDAPIGPIDPQRRKVDSDALDALLQRFKVAPLTRRRAVEC